MKPRSCKAKYKQSKTPEDYLNQRLDKSGDCWIWKFGVDKNGYGQCQAARVAIKNKVTRAHQLAYVAWNGPIPEGRIVCHKCDTPRCCNPKHLYAGTWKDNVTDCIIRGRYKSGAKKRFDREDVIALEGVTNCFGAALLVGISYSQVCAVWRGDGW